MNSCGYGQRLKFEFVSASTQKLSHGMQPNLLGESYNIVKNVRKYCYNHFRMVGLLSCITRSHVWRKAVWSWYKAMRGPAGFSLGL